MLLILKKLFATRSFSDIFRYDSPKKFPTILFAANLWLKPASATKANWQHVGLNAPLFPSGEVNQFMWIPCLNDQPGLTVQCGRPFYSHNSTCLNEFRVSQH